MSTRRRFLLHTGFARVALATTRFDLLAYDEDLWTTASEILARIKGPASFHRAISTSPPAARSRSDERHRQRPRSQRRN